jgi:methylenetetrahydrofolate dehydrogenase (NAD+)
LFVVQEANEDPRVHGILVYYPIFGQEETFSGASQDDYLRDSVSYKCDVEGLCHLYRSNLYRNVRYLEPGIKCLVPCTALSVVKILEACGCFDLKKPIKQQLHGTTVTIINRSEIVGRPLAAMLANDGAKVFSVDVNSIFQFAGGRLAQVDTSPEECVRQSNIVVTGVPVISYRLPTAWIRPNTVVVNVASYKNVDEEALLQIPGVLYVPQVGKVTVAMLERNLMRLHEQFHDQDGRRTSQKQSALVQPPMHPVQIYTAVAVTVLLALHVARFIKNS